MKEITTVNNYGEEEEGEKKDVEDMIRTARNLFEYTFNM